MPPPPPRPTTPNCPTWTPPPPSPLPEPPPPLEAFGPLLLGGESRIKARRRPPRGAGCVGIAKRMVLHHLLSVDSGPIGSGLAFCCTR